METWRFFIFIKMSKPWMGYLSSLLFFFAGILMIVGGKPVVGSVFLVLTLASAIINFKINKRN